MADAICETLLRYVTVRAAVLRPRSVESLINDLLPFADFLTTHHPEVTSLDGLDRSHIEGFRLEPHPHLAWATRRRRRRTHHLDGRDPIDVLSLRNLLDDLTEWGWEPAPPRRLLFAADVPKLDQPLPRALAPDVDGVVMNAVAGPGPPSSPTPA
ncbi:MAG: hypothetical protein EOP24_42390 [Hyphomicrobiales bacterium]|nr:MAG: hypothetical protein EOP24_42390 [Hyphomicrobiales bacterium]